MRHVKRTVGFAAVLVIGLWHSAGLAATAGTAGTATYTVQQLGPSSYEYNVTLTNTGNTPIGSFWFGWFPGYDLLPNIPTSITSPAGWSGVHMEEGIGGSSVLWSDSTLLQPNQSQGGFIFDTPDSPSVMSGTSQFFGFPTSFSYVYSGPAEGFGTTFGTFTPQQVTATPEPASILLAPGMLLLMRRRLR